MGFIRKVYGILTAQLILTAIVCVIPFISPGMRSLFQSFTLLIICFIASFVIILLLVCVQDLARKVPTNYILLTSFTVLEAYLVASCCA